MGIKAETAGAHGSGSANFGISSIFIAVFIALTAIWQGGFTDMAWCVSGIVFAGCVLFAAKKLPPRAVALPLASLALLYVASALLHGAHFESAAQAMKLIAALLAFVALCNLNRDLKSLNITVAVVLAGAVSAAACLAAFFGIARVPEARFGWRLQGTFRYANAAGIFFAVCAFMARTGLSSRKKHVAFLFEAMLLLTQSIGAIATYALAWMLRLFAGKRRGAFFALLGAAACGGAALLYVRGAGQIAASYLDRVIQISDGAATMLRAPLGIGPGLWGLRVLELQSAFYSSAKMHSYVIEMGVDAGLPAVAALAALIAVWAGRVRKSGLLPRHIAAMMLLFHGLVDITFGFLTLVFLLITLVAPDFSDGMALGRRPRLAGGAAAVLFCGIMAAQLGSRNLAAWESQMESQSVAPESVIAEYARDDLITALDEYRYAKALLYLGRRDEAADSALRCIRLARYLPDGYELLDSIVLEMAEGEGEKYSAEAAEIRAEAERTEHPLYRHLSRYKNAGAE
jgi:hypothetical protein